MLTKLTFRVLTVTTLTVSMGMLAGCSTATPRDDQSYDPSTDGTLTGGDGTGGTNLPGGQTGGTGNNGATSPDPTGGGSNGTGSDSSTNGNSGATTGVDANGTTGDSNGSTTGGGGNTTSGTSDEDASVPPPVETEGCGNTAFPASGMYNMTVGSTQRMFIIKLPSGYDPNKPYKLVFAWHYLGGSASGIANSNGFGGFGRYYGLEPMSGGSTIFVAPEGLDSGLGGKGWPNSNGRDVAFARAMVDKFNKDYCIDAERVFSVGFSYGAIMSNTVGCQMGDVFRAIAPMSGMAPQGACKGPVAAWISHGDPDGTVNFSGGEASRDHWAEANHCTTPGAKDANGCVNYQGCDAGYPVVWCAMPGAGHNMPSFGTAEIWKFFSQF